MDAREIPPEPGKTREDRASRPPILLPGAHPLPQNPEVASLLERVADLYDAQQASSARVLPYREAARALRAPGPSVASLVHEHGRAGVERLPGFDRALSSAIEEIAYTGRLRLLDRLSGEVSPEELFASIPGVGDTLARRVHRSLGLETLEELELAAHDGRLERVDGFGPRRALAVRDVLGATLQRSARRRSRLLPTAGRPSIEPLEVPPLSLVLTVDKMYRELAMRGALRTIVPRRLNPDHAAWLPVLHTEQQRWSFTAMFSNTWNAHRLGRTDDWVVVYHERDGDEGQCTIVTQSEGPHAGSRVVCPAGDSPGSRGREA